MSLHLSPPAAPAARGPAVPPSVRAGVPAFFGRPRRSLVERAAGGFLVMASGAAARKRRAAEA